MADARITIATEDMVDVLPYGSEAPEAFPAEMLDDNWKSSEAFVRSDGSSASPTITITESTIWVYWHAAGGARITSTHLSGDGGDYSFTAQGRSYEIEPGRYRHKVTGNIITPPGGSIASGIRYK